MAEEADSSPPPKKIIVVDDGNVKPHRTLMVQRYAHSDRRSLLSALLIILLLAGVTALVLYLVYRPSDPHFSVTAAAIYSLGDNATAAADLAPATAVSTSLQFTILIRNPNDRTSVRYDRLSAYVAYRGQAITPPAPLPPLFQEKDSSVMVSPVLGGAPVPVSGDVATGLATDGAYGVVPLRLVVLGRVRYKAGPFHSGWHGLNVRCDMLVGIKQGVAGQAPLLGAPDCDVDA